MEWEKQPEWHGNPALGYDSYKKYFGNVPVYVFGIFPDINFCVSAGKSSDRSYTGCFYPEKPDFKEFMEKVDELTKQNKLIR
jgi:hypothetical protein